MKAVSAVSLLYADDVIILASVDSDIQCRLGRFVAEGKSSWEECQHLKCEAMVLCWKIMARYPEGMRISRSYMSADAQGCSHCIRLS